MQILAAPAFSAPRVLPQKLPVANPGQRPRDSKKVENLCFGGALGAATYLAATAGPSTYLHELGHKLAIEKLYSGTTAEISIQPFKGGVTKWSAQALSPLGQQLGSQASRAAVAMAGTAMDALSACALFATGYKLHKKHPLTGNALMGYGVMTMANSTLYAASGIGKGVEVAKAGHDFVTLQTQMGIPCWVSTAVVASLIPLTYLAMRALDSQR